MSPETLLTALGKAVAVEKKHLPEYLQNASRRKAVVQGAEEMPKDKLMLHVASHLLQDTSPIWRTVHRMLPPSVSRMCLIRELLPAT